MTIVCGTDFSEASAEAVTVAWHLAEKMHMPMHLVHAVDTLRDSRDGAATERLLEYAQAQLGLKAEELRRSGVRVECHVELGLPDEVMRETARKVSAKLIVLGALGQRRAKDWQLGSHADRTAERTHVPVLVVRRAAAFEDWVKGKRPLRVVLGVDASLSSETAGRWITQLAAFGPCDVVLAHLYWPPAEFHRLGLGGLRSWVDRDAAITRTLEQEYAERFSALFSATRVSYQLEPHFGRIGDGLASLASKEKADLVVVGCHDRGVMARAWEGSVSKHVLRCAQTSVACIPAPVETQLSVTPTIRSVLAVTDFSVTGNAAIPLAYSVVNYGGTVHLVHVLEASLDPIEPHDIFRPTGGDDAPQVKAARAHLAELVPKDFGGAAASTQPHVLESRNPAAAICQAAERLGVDLICLGTHGRSGLARALLGSVATSVLEQTTRPILLARAKPE
jgi:nucleotide-binding universal stress UspA family protein